MTEQVDKKNIEDFYPLSPMQKGMLFHSLYTPETGAYVEQTSCRLQGNLHSEAFAAAWQLVVDRHAILRTGFVGQGLKEPVQVVHRNIRLPFHRFDFRGMTRAEQEVRLERLRSDDLARGFDVSKPPLMRVTLVQLAEDTFHFVWTYHHILMDGWSVPILLQEVFALHEAAGKGREITLPPPQPYREYIRWLTKQDTEKAAEFWKENLKGFGAPTSLPLAWSRPNVALPEAGEGMQEFSLDSSTTAALQAMVRRHRLTPNTLMQGVWALLLSRYTGEEDVLFGSTVSGRPPDLPGAESMIGLFINTLPVRVRVPRNANLIPWLSELQAHQLELRQYEYSSLVDIQSWSEVPGSIPLFETLFVFENYPVSSVSGEGFGELIIQDIRSRERTNYPLTIVGGPGQELFVRVAYDRSRFDEQTVSDMLMHFRTAFERISANPDIRLADLDLLSSVDREKVVVTWNKTAPVLPEKRFVHELFEMHTADSPDAIAAEYDGQRMTYGELNRRANQLAHHLLTVGVGLEGIVGILLEPSFELLVATLAILKAGGAFLPLNPSYPKERIRFMLEDAAVTHLITRSRYLEPSFRSGMMSICVDHDWKDIGEGSTKNPSRTIMSRGLAYVIYTSGSTGRPKGSLLVHEGLRNVTQCFIRDYDISRSSRILQLFSHGFDGYLIGLFSALAGGGTLCMTNQEALLSPADLRELMRAQQITVLMGVPSVLSMLAHESISSLKTIVAGGEACSVELGFRWGEGRRFINAYGPTETTIAASHYVLSERPEQALTMPIGRPLANVRLYVLGENLQPVPISVPGELYVGGVGVGRGYLNQPALTAETFVPDPFSVEPGMRMYRTGDKVRYLHDGNIEFLRRKDEQVKVRGFRVELGEIEAWLAECAGIRDALVLIREDVPGDKRIVAYVVAQPDSGVSAEELKSALSDKLPPHMIPSAFVMMDAFPLSPSGKIDRGVLPPPSRSDSGSETAHVAPRNTVELQLAQIWEEILNVRPIGVRADFFELGGHSLLAMRLLAQIEQKFGRTIPLVSLYQEPTIEHLSRLLQPDPESHASQTLVELRKGSGRPPLFLVHPTGGSVHWYADLARHVDSGQSVYGLQARGLDGKENPDTRIETMASRYVEAIRSKFPLGPYSIGGWSLGVIIAFEVAQQLRALGHTVLNLVVLDQGPKIPIVEQPRDDAEFLTNIFEDHFSLDPEYLRTLEPDEQFRFVLKKAKSAKLIPFYVRLKDFRHYVSMNHAQTQAWREYVPTKYPGKVTVIRCLEQDPDSSSERDFGWSELATEGVEIIEVPGNHISMMQEPHVRVLASRLTASLREAAAATASG